MVWLNFLGISAVAEAILGKACFQGFCEAMSDEQNLAAFIPAPLQIVRSSSLCDKLDYWNFSLILYNQATSYYHHRVQSDNNCSYYYSKIGFIDNNIAFCYHCFRKSGIRRNM